jgi:hypothetical protein
MNGEGSRQDDEPTWPEYRASGFEDQEINDQDGRKRKRE